MDLLWNIKPICYICELTLVFYISLQITCMNSNVKTSYILPWFITVVTLLVLLHERVEVQVVITTTYMSNYGIIKLKVILNQQLFWNIGFVALCTSSQTTLHGRLRSYDHFLIPYTPSCEPHLTADGVTYSASLSRYFRGMRGRWGVGIRLTRGQFTTEQQPVLRPAVAFSKTSFKHR